ncbi:MAG: FtsQ-type POTRA domain-containing protein [Alphaproteobacteria bacterium]|nr:FtsQ-type POTRA domain-containing protein [Alphaproteobacteria bacterium]
MRHLMAEPRAPAAGRRKPRRQAANPWPRRRILVAVAGVAIAVAIGVLARPWWQPVLIARAMAIGAATERATVAMGMGVREVYASGRRETGRKALIAALDVAIGEPLLFLDLATRRDRLAALPWVDAVVIERRLPDVLIVRLTERRPMALWQNDGEAKVIDRSGEVIAGVDPRWFSELPLVVGEGAPEHAAELLAVLAGEPAVAAMVTAAIRVGERRWDIRFANGITVRMPANGLAAAWAHVAELDRTHALLKREVQTIDLRLADRMFLRLTPEGAEALKTIRETGTGEST